MMHAIEIACISLIVILVLVIVSVAVIVGVYYTKIGKGETSTVNDLLNFINRFQPEFTNFLDDYVDDKKNFVTENIKEDPYDIYKFLSGITKI